MHDSQEKWRCDACGNFDAKPRQFPTGEHGRFCPSCYLALLSDDEDRQRYRLATRAGIGLAYFARWA